MNAWSEIYQWKDKHGQTHFGDRPPNHESAVNISDKVQEINITKDMSSPEMMLKHELLKESERKEKYEAWKEQESKRPSLSHVCKQAKQTLKNIKRRVIFVDEQGNEVKVSEEERKQRVITLENDIKENCP